MTERRFPPPWVWLSLVVPLAANATQIVPGGVEYSNDKIGQNGKIQACIVTAAIISPPAPEIVNRTWHLK